MTLWQAVERMSEARWLTASSVSLRLLRRMTELGYATDCGRLFHVTPECDRVAAHLRFEAQRELFE